MAFISSESGIMNRDTPLKKNLSEKIIELLLPARQRTICRDIYNQPRGVAERLSRGFGSTGLKLKDTKRSGRAVDCTGLENRHPFTRIGGSNPSSSAE